MTVAERAATALGDLRAEYRALLLAGAEVNMPALAHTASALGRSAFDADADQRAVRRHAAMTARLRAMPPTPTLRKRLRAAGERVRVASAALSAAEHGHGAAAAGYKHAQEAIRRREELLHEIELFERSHGWLFAGGEDEQQEHDDD